MTGAPAGDRRLVWVSGAGRSAALLAAGLLTVSACVELTGQRITWFHDVAADRLQFLIHYDGIHESNGWNSSGKEEIPPFIANEEILEHIVDRTRQSADLCWLETGFLKPQNPAWDRQKSRGGLGEINLF